MSGRRIIVTGASGMIGGLVVRFALEHAAVAEVTTIGRRPSGVAHSKLTDVTHDDFTRFDAVETVLERRDAVIWCLGAYTGAVPDDEFRRITTDFTIAFADALETRSPDAAFCFLSGQGADLSGRSRIPFARYKGMAEKDLLKRGFSRLHIFRPGYIYPVTPRREPNRMYELMRPLYPLVRRIYPDIGIASDDLARVMVKAAIDGTPGHDDPILENRDIRRLSRTGMPIPDRCA